MHPDRHRPTDDLISNGTPHAGGGAPVPGGGAPTRWVAPYYDREHPHEYHTSPDCPVGAAIPADRRHLDVAAMRARLPGW